MTTGIGRYLKQEYIWATARIALGWMLFWAFIDKVFGLGFSTTPQQSWLSGASPTTGFLKFGVSGIFADLFKAMAGNVLVDVLFMAGLLLVGIALLLGIGTKIAGYPGEPVFFHSTGQIAISMEFTRGSGTS